ncbi:MAG: T9SS type A sorting domain-containing protein [Bacteroidales bacterium]|nr:T9SS type A sorting domain-containing protein [Bacteroidales bacterium]MBN2762046.1 T9SS type A sorting domain-containing protein [Bacteroidales bacterium]
MKRIIVFMSIMTGFFNVSAQLAKEYAFNDQASVNIHMVRLEISGKKICVVNRNDSISYECVFYNSDYSEYKTVSINLGPLFIVSDYCFPSLDVSYIAESVFDQDPDIDLLCQLTYYDGEDAEYAQVVVFNEDGSALFTSDVVNSNAWLINSSLANSSLISSLTNTGDGAKMILDVYYFNDGLFSYDVYDLPGILPSFATEHQLTGESVADCLRAYPVPSDEYVNIDYKLAGDQQAGFIVITDELGRTVQRVRVTTNRGTIRVPLASYKTGPYLYKANTSRGVSRSGKMMIVK